MYGTEIIVAENESDFQITTDIIIAYYEDLGENCLCYNGTALYDNSLNHVDISLEMMTKSLYNLRSIT